MSKDYEIKIVFENITDKLAEKVYDAIDELISHDFTDNYSMLGKNYVRLEVKDQQISELQHQLKVSEKALELACKEITGSCEYCSYKTMPECPIEANCLDEKINYFKTEAKEIMKSE